QAKRVVVKATVDVYGQELAILAIHAPRPVRSPLHKYEEFWGILLDELKSERANGHMLLIGDYNATPYSLIYRTLTSEYGLQDSHVTCGRGVATTWPNGTELLPPIRIDHALLTPGVTCLGIREGVGAGTDHKPLILDLAIPGERTRESGSPAPASTEQTLAATRY
ncbi:MAG: endonuclease/exonuclease/phosphatase family protein, partial [Planctomycetota bacterium]